MKYIYLLLAVFVVILIGLQFIPFMYAALRVLVALGVVIIFGVGVWMGTLFNKIP